MNDIKVLEFLFYVEAFNRIVFLGEDRFRRQYWFVSNTDVKDVVFVSNRVGYDGVVRWGFYGMVAIEELLFALNIAG